MIHVFIGVMELQKLLDDVNATDENGDPLLDENGDQIVTLGVKSVLKAQEKAYCW